MKAQLLIAGGDQLGFHRGQRRQSHAYLCVVAGCTLREAQIKLEVARLGALQTGVETADRLGQSRRQQRKALARTSLDQRSGQQQVELSRRLMLP